MAADVPIHLAGKYKLYIYRVYTTQRNKQNILPPVAVAVFGGIVLAIVVIANVCYCAVLVATVHI